MTQILFKTINKNRGVDITQNRSKELIKLKYVLVLLTVYLVNEWKIGRRQVIKDVINNIQLIKKKNEKLQILEKVKKIIINIKLDSYKYFVVR